MRGRLPAGQDVVADGDFLEIASLDDALVDAFKAAADNDDAVTGGQFADASLSEWFAARGSSAGAGALSPSGVAASMALASTSGFSTMPGPPPAGVSSTEECLSVA
jgi:hypothetical protein